MNTLKTTALLGLLTGLLLFFGGYFGGNHGIIIAFMFAMIMNISAYWFSDKIVLKMYRAKEVKESDAPKIYSLVARISQKVGIPMPKVFVVPSEAPNAFATGRNPQHSAVAVTQGIMRILDENELEGVLAHEIAHIKNRDTLVSCVSATLAGAIMMLASMARFAAIFGGLGRGSDNRNQGNVFALLFMAILAPIAAMLIQFAISRTREYLADSSASDYVGSPHGLANALRKLDYASKRVPLQANPSTAHLFIVNPLSGKSFLTLFSTHPAIEERIKRLIGR